MGGKAILLNEATINGKKIIIFINYKYKTIY